MAGITFILSFGADEISSFTSGRKFPDTLVAGSDQKEGQVVVYSYLISGAGVSGNIKCKISFMQRLAIFSFIGIVVLLWVSAAHESAARDVQNKTGGIAGTYVSAKPPVLGIVVDAKQ